MKKRLTVLSVLVFVASMATQARALPLCYTFEGSVLSIYDRNNSGIPASAGLSVGSPVSYVLLIDLGRDGFYSYGSSQYPQTDRSYTYTGTGNTYSYTYDYFYVDYVGGDALTHAPSSGHHYNYGYDYSYRVQYPSYTYTYDRAYLYAVSRLYITSPYDGDFADWTVGDVFNSYNYFGPYPNSGHVYSRLELTSISTTNPIPEPTSLLLLGAGLVGSAVLRRKSRNG